MRPINWINFSYSFIIKDKPLHSILDRFIRIHRNSLIGAIIKILERSVNMCWTSNTPNIVSWKHQEIAHSLSSELSICFDMIKLIFIATLKGVTILSFFYALHSHLDSKFFSIILRIYEKSSCLDFREC